MKKCFIMLGGMMWFLAFLFMKISLQWKGLCDMGGDVEIYNIVACIRGEIFAPFPYIFIVLGIGFLGIGLWGMKNE